MLRTNRLSADELPSEEALIRDHLPIVQYMVSDLSRRLPKSVRRDELVSAGLLGLTQAARSFDPGRGVTFARFARTRINGALLDELRSRDGVSRSVRSMTRAVGLAADELSAKLGRAPSSAEVAARAGITEQELARLNYDVHRASTLDLDNDVVDDNSATASRASQSDPLDVLVNRESHAYVRDAVAMLPERLRVVVVGYFFDERPMEELARQLGVTESRVSQMRAEALSLIGEAMAIHLGDEPVEQAAGVAARRRAAYAAAVGTASDFRSRLDLVAIHSAAPAPVAASA